MAPIPMLFLNSLCVLGVLSGFFLLTAEHAKIFVTVFNTKLLPIILCVLSVLRGFILNATAEPAETAKIFCKGLRIKPYLNASAFLAPFALPFY